MEGKLAENIRALRKEKKMTQEQLAECLDVTVGAVSKWESGATTPDLSMIMELAHFFAVSVDALLGYQWQNSSLEQTLERLKKLRQQRDYQQAIQLGEKELRRYPNHFQLVYQLAMLHLDVGAENDKSHVYRGQELLCHAMELFGQNTDPELSLWTLKNKLGDSYLYGRQPEQAVKIYRENNVNGVNNARIAQALSDTMKRHEEAMPYAQKAFRQLTEDLSETMVALASIYYGKMQLEEAGECMRWMISTLETMRPDKGFCETDMAVITILSSLGEFFLDAGDRERAKEYLLKAHRLARAYDMTPIEQVVTCRFFEGRLEGRHLLDYGAGGTEYLKTRLHRDTREEQPELYAMFEEVSRQVDEEVKAGALGEYTLGRSGE